MIMLRWSVLAVIDVLMLLTLPLAVPVIAAFTRQQLYGLQPYIWGGLWGTYDNPPQGDQGFVRERCWFPSVTTGFRGYLNRINWMLRNPLYGFARRCAVDWQEGTQVQHIGNPDISDKYGMPGWYLAAAFAPGYRFTAFELYCVLPWSKSRGLRMRLGWKIMTSKFQTNGFAPLVNTFNPFDGYGTD